MNAMTKVNDNRALATQGFDPFAQYGEEAQRGGATFLKFVKGEWNIGQDDKSDHTGRRLAARMDGLMIGWVHWTDKRPDDRRMGLLVERFQPPARSELGETDQAEWIGDATGKPQDPWQRTNELPLADPETGEQLLFSASSAGGIGAIGKLCAAYSKEGRLREGQVPIVELGVDSYKHTAYGKVFVPTFTIVDWADPDAEPAEHEAAEPAKPEPKRAAASARTRF